jgi:hypothetical protein
VLDAAALFPDTIEPPRHDGSNPRGGGSALQDDTLIDGDAMDPFAIDLAAPAPAVPPPPPPPVVISPRAAPPVAEKASIPVEPAETAPPPAPAALPAPTPDEAPAPRAAPESPEAPPPSRAGPPRLADGAGNVSAAITKGPAASSAPTKPNAAVATLDALDEAIAGDRWARCSKRRF